MKNSFKTIWKSNLFVRIGIIALAVLLVAGSGILITKILSNSRNIPADENLETDNSLKETPSQNGTAIGPSVTPFPDAIPVNSMAYFLGNNKENYLRTGLSLTGKELKEPETGAVGTWDIPVPLINPLGSQELYTYDTSYYEKRGHGIQYISNYTEYSRNLYGELWYLRVNEYALPLQFLKDYATQIGAEIYSSSYSDRLIFNLKQPDALWWCDARETYYGYELNVLKQKLIEPAKEYTVTKEEMDASNGEYPIFTTISTGKKFQTVRINIPDGKVRIYARYWKGYANSNEYCYYDTVLYSDEYNTYILDNIPQGAGQLEWMFDDFGGELPSNITFMLEENYALPNVKEGNEPGAILVKGVPFGSAFVQPQRFLSISYKQDNHRDTYEYNQEYKGSRTPEGDTLFVLPAGLWTVGSRSAHMNHGSVKTQLVPVSSGEQTVVSMPDSLRSADARLNSISDDSELIGSVEIVETKDLTATAEISVSVSDPLDRDINPTIETTEIFEGATNVEITDIRRVVAPCSVALVIDSSGSMKSDMNPALEAAKQFLESLPEGSFVKVIDFDTKVKVLKGETPAEAVKALSEITSGGYTKLYDATLKGIETVLGKTRPAVVVFTDGRDSSHDNTGGGSSSSKSTVIDKIKESKIPVYTIGFGKRLNEEEKASSSAPVDGVPDIQCLLEFASAAGGQYYPAKDPEALPGVFAAISSKLGNNFVITYKRPTEYNISQTPFISMVVDNSGSMSSHPDEGKDCNFRMQKTLSLFHDFIAKLPDNVMMQYTTFQTPTMAPPLVIMHQTTTGNKANLLKSLGEMKAGGGTPIVEALRTAYENILPVPSSRKVILFLTDSGLEVNPEQQQQYQNILEEIREKNITILFVGMGAHSREELFSEAAKATGGDYVISEDINEIQTKLDKLLGTLKETTPPKTIPISISLSWETSDGEELSYGVASEVEFSLPQKAGPPLEPDMVEITTGLPFGFLEPIMAGPASASPVRMAFEIPWQMSKYKSGIYTDLATGSKELPVSSGEVYGAPAAVDKQDGPGVSVTVNQLVAPDGGVKLSDPDGETRNLFSSSIILDVTISDLPGNEGTRIPDDFFVLVNKNYQAPSSEITVGRIGIGGGQQSDSKLINKANETNNLAFGVKSDFGVFEGQSRRGIILFSKPNGDLADWTLQSPYMESLQVPISTGTFASPELIGYTTEVQINREFEDQLDAAVKAAVARHAALMEETSRVTQIGLTDGDGRENVPMPPISTYGLKLIDQIKTETQVIRTLQALRCLPTNRNEGYLLSYGYKPEAVLTQGWGDIGDMTNLALRLFTRLGFNPEARPLELTEAGKKILHDFSGVKVDYTKPLGIAYKNAAGEHKMLVIPFMMDISELEGFVYYQSDIVNMGLSHQQANIEVYVRYVPGTIDGSVGAVTGGMAGSLAGDEGGESVERLCLLETRIEIAEACTDALDLSFMPRSSTSGTNNYVAVLSTPKGIITGETVLENPAQVLGIEIVVGHISGIDPPLVHYSTLGEGVSLSNFFQTIALNLPDLTEEAASILDEVARKVHDAASNPDPLSIAKWYGRNAIYSFISGSSMFDNQMVDQFRLVMGRTYRPRCLIVSTHLDKAGTMQTTMDLLQPWNQIHASEEEAEKAYNLLSGFYMSSLEAAVLPGDNKAGYVDLWTQAPSGTAFEIIPVLDDGRNEVVTEMEAANKYPPLLLKAVKENQKLILTPLEPTVFNGEKRWAWLEIDPKNYQAISVFDNGLHSAMTEFKLNLLPSEDDTVNWLKGIWVGTNVSVWSMCSSTLKYGDDYKAVFADAKKNAEEICKKVAEFFSLVETAKSLAGGETGAGLDLGSHKIDFKISMGGIKGSLSQNMYNLGGGMKTAIEVYFAMAAPPTPSPPPTDK